MNLWYQTEDEAFSVETDVVKLEETIPLFIIYHLQTIRPHPQSFPGKKANIQVI